MCKIWSIVYDCGHTHQVRISECLGKTVKHGQTPFLTPQIRCHGNGSSLQFAVYSDCGPCSREAPEQELKAAFEAFRLDPAHRDDWTALAEAELRFGEDMHALHARFPGSWGKKVREAGKGRDVTCADGVVKSRLRNEILPEDVEDDAEGWTEYVSDWSCNVWATEASPSEEAAAGGFQPAVYKPKKGRAPVVIEEFTWNDVPEKVADGVASPWADEDETYDNEDENNKENITPPTTITITLATPSPSHPTNSATPKIPPRLDLPTASANQFPTPPPTPTAPTKVIPPHERNIDRLQARLDDAMVQNLVEKMQTYAEMQGMAVVIST